MHPVFLLVFLCAVQGVQIKSISPGQKWPGFCFALLQYNPIQAFTARFVLFNYTAHCAKQRTVLYRGFSCDCTRSAAYDTRPTQAAIIPPAPRWNASQRRNASSAYQIPAPRRTLYRSAQPPYIIRYISAYHIADHASPAGSAPTICGSLASATPGAPAEGSASPPVQGQPGGL